MAEIELQTLEDKSAEDNPWYLLFTLYGEPLPTMTPKERDERNRLNCDAWNKFILGGMNNLELAPLFEVDPKQKNWAHLRFSRGELEGLFQRRAWPNSTIELPSPSGIANFAGMVFENNFDAQGRIFGKVTFRNAIFRGSVRFQDAIFLKYATFSGVVLHKHGSFRRAKFLGNAYFSGAELFDTADFRSVAISGAAEFSGVTFWKSSSFSNANFGDRSFFSSANFTGNPPNFGGAKLHEETNFRDAKWPLPPKDEELAGSFIDAYGHLKREMDKLKNHEDELMFFGEELKARRVLLGHWRGMPIALYGAVCDYGRSYMRPLVWMVAVWAAGVTAPLNLAWKSFSFVDSMWFSFVSLFGGLGFRKDGYTAEKLSEFPRALMAVSLVESLAGLALFFFFGLALRNRFRMK